MLKADRMLIAICAGLIGLVAIAFAVLLTRPKPAYWPEHTPAAAVHNYLLALQTGDEAQAYGYISPAAKGYPRTLAAFHQSLLQNNWAFSSLQTATLDIGQSVIIGNTATVKVAEHDVRSDSVFGGSGSSTTLTFTTQRSADGGLWQITTGDNFWAYCWDNSEGC